MNGKYSKIPLFCYIPLFSDMPLFLPMPLLKSRLQKNRAGPRPALFFIFKVFQPYYFINFLIFSVASNKGTMDLSMLI